MVAVAVKLAKVQYLLWARDLEARAAQLPLLLVAQLTRRQTQPLHPHPVRVVGEKGQQKQRDANACHPAEEQR